MATKKKHKGKKPNPFAKKAGIMDEMASAKAVGKPKGARAAPMAPKAVVKKKRKKTSPADAAKAALMSPKGRGLKRNLPGGATMMGGGC